MRHIFLLFSFFLVHNVSLIGAWRGFVPEGRLEEFWGGDVPLEPLAYTRPISNFFLPTIYLFITHLFGFL